MAQLYVCLVCPANWQALYKEAGREPVFVLEEVSPPSHNSFLFAFANDVKLRCKNNLLCQGMLKSWHGTDFRSLVQVNNCPVNLSGGRILANVV